MKASTGILLGLFGHAAATATNPISRVTDLLKNLADKVEKEGKAEEKLFQKFVCWGKTNIAAKQASNEEARAKIEELTTYIEDIEAGRIEFTSERVDLQKELQQITDDIKESTGLRDKEHTGYLQAKEEMERAIAALEKAVEVLGEATEGHEKGTLLSVGSSSSLTARVQDAEKMDFAVELGSKLLSKGDAVFLERLLTGDAEVPKADWKKLNRKATFKMSYKARSFKIQDVLKKMQQTFETNLADANSKEDEAVAQFEKISKAKGAEKEAAETALAEMSGENGARGQTKEQSQAELDALNQQVESDEKYIAQLQDTLKTKRSEWDVRSGLRAGEIAAISKAITILSNDDAKDLFKKSYSSQGYLFLQESSKSRGEVAAMLISASAGDARMVKVAARVASKGRYDEVVGAIDKMVAQLKEEEETELEKKQTCEADRMKDTRDAVVKSRKIDELTDKVSTLKKEISETEATMKENDEKIKANEDSLAQATQDRKDENAVYQNNHNDDKAAADLVENAKTVLEGYYKDNGLMLTQRVAPAGDAPPPPPETFEGEYKGATGESGGIISVLAMIKEDIEKDMSSCTKEEKAAEAAFQKIKSETEASIVFLQEQNSELDGMKSEKLEEVETAKGDSRTLSGDLSNVMKIIADRQPGCDYFTINYPVRLKNRKTEIDGLVKAKAILQGGNFGGSFLQQRKF